MKTKKDMDTKAANLMNDLKEKAFPTHTPTPVEDIDSGNLLQVAKFALDCIVEQNIWDEEHSDTGPTLQNKNAETMLQVAIAKAEGK